MRATDQKQKWQTRFVTDVKWEGAFTICHYSRVQEVCSAEGSGSKSKMSYSSPAPRSPWLVSAYGIFEADNVSAPCVLSMATEEQLLLEGWRARAKRDYRVEVSPARQWEQSRPSVNGRQAQLGVQTTRDACGDKAGLRSNWEVSQGQGQVQ